MDLHHDELCSIELNHRLVDRVRMLMMERDLNIPKLSFYSGVHRQTIRNCFYHKNCLQLHTVVRLANYFGVSVDWLVGLTEDR